MLLADLQYVSTLITSSVTPTSISVRAVSVTELTGLSLGTTAAFQYNVDDSLLNSVHHHGNPAYSGVG